MHVFKGVPIRHTERIGTSKTETSGIKNARTLHLARGRGADESDDGQGTSPVADAKA